MGNETVVLGPGGTPDPETERARDEIFAVLVDRLNSGQAIDASEVRARWPEHAAAVLERLRDFEALGRDGPERGDPDAGEERVFGDYRILRELGRGGMGVVYEAIETSMDRRVAVKVLPPGLLLDARSVTRFQREARIAGKLRHPNIVAVHGTGIHEKTPYIAMELVEGEGLDRILARRRENPAEMDLTGSIQTAGAFAAVAEGLQHAHSMGVLHRDLKPSNLILDREGKLRILDFGLARLEGQESLTASREIVGTPRYMSPEVARAGAAPVDHRTDIFSLGASLYEALTATPPFPGATAQDAISQILNHEPRALRSLNPRIPRDLETIVLKCIEKSPADRYLTAEALAQDLRRFARGDPIEARPQSAVEKIARRIRRNKGKMAIGAAVLLLLVSAAWFARKSQLEAGRARIAQYDVTVAGAVARMQMGVFTESASHFAWAGLGFDGMRLSTGLKSENYGETLFQDVMRSLEGAIAAVPERPEARYHLARLLILGKKIDRAEEELRLAAERGSTPAMVLLASVLDERGRSPEAGELRKRALATPEGLWAETLIEADRAALDGRWPDALKACEKAIDLARASNLHSDASAESYMGCGVARLLAGRHEDARSALQTAGALRPGALEPELLIGVAWRSEGNAAAAEEVFERLHAREEAANTKGGTATNDVACWVTMLYWSRFHDLERALKWAERIPPSYERELWRATCLSSLRPGPEAVAVARRLVEMNPDAGLSYFIVALAHLGAGDFPNTADMAAKAAERAPSSSMPRVILAEALRQQGRFAECHAALLEATRVEPGSAMAHFYLGLSFMGQSLLEDAERSFERCMETSKGGGGAYVSLGEAHLRLGEARLALGKKDVALETFRSAVEACRAERTWSPPAHLALAALLFEKGERIEAIRVIEEALDSRVADESVASRLPRRFEEYATAVLPDLPTYRAVDLALRRQSRTEIVAEGARWRLHRGSSSPSPGLEWTGRDFDDAGWEEAPSGFGYGDEDDATVIGDMRGQFTTIYIRTKFAIPADVEGRRLLLVVTADDGFIAYLNGTEVGRHHAPDTAVVPHDATASEEAVEPLLPVEIVLDPGLLSGTGDQVLAIQGLNSARESSDLSLIPVLRAERPNDAACIQRVLQAFEAAADPSRDAGRLAYLRGRLHEAEGRPEKAAAELAIAAGLDQDRPEPAVALARMLRAMGRAPEARSRLEPLLARYGSRSLWRLWLSICLVDLKVSAGEILKRLPAPEDMPRPASGMRVPPSSRAAGLRWLFGALDGGEVLRIRSGGEDWTSPGGASWSRDRFFTSGQIYGGSRRFDGEIEGTDEDPLYQTERYFPASAPDRAPYEIPLPPARYRVTLHFAEIWHSEPRQRVFDVLLEGQTVLEGFEPGAAGFATAVRRSFEVDVSDGLLEIGLRRRIGNPKVSAIEIEPVAR